MTSLTNRADRELTLREAVPLCLVMVQALLGEAGIRNLAIKGPAFVTLQVRPPKQSNDADVLVDPARFHGAVDVLAGSGWAPLLAGMPDDVQGLHSVTLCHPDWPNTLDLHHHFPGILAPAQPAFEALWEGRSEVTMARRPLPTLSRPAALAVEVLHDLRGINRDEASAVAVATIHRMPRPLTGEEADEFVGLAPRLGAAYSLREALASFGVPVPAASPDGAEDRVQRANWERLEFMGMRGSGWLGLVHWRHPLRSVRALGQHAFLDEVSAQRWAHSQGVTYRGRPRVLLTRIGRALAALRVGVARRWWR